MPIPDRHTRTALPSVLPHSEPLASSGFGLPCETISGRFCCASTTSLPGVAPPFHETMSTRPFLYATIVPWPCRSGAALSPLRKKPPPLSRERKPLLNVASSRQRSPYGTCIGPLGLALGGSYLPGYSASCVRVWSNHATYATIRGYAGSERNVVTRTGDAPFTMRPVDLHTPSPGSAGRRIGATRFGR